jgi:UDP-N-acetyl-D-glucosamine/UDP-N-acetyl-D-galactosamine dehydrogenase
MNNTKLCLIGLGYVGLPLAVAFAGKFKVIDFLKSKEIIQYKKFLI